jgi:hypothetical protein
VRQKGDGAPPVRGSAATTTRPNQEAGPRPEFTAPGRPAELVTAGEGCAYVDPVWVEELARERAEDAKIRDAVCRLIARATCTTGGVLPVGSPEWWDAPAAVQLASVAVAGQEYVPETPEKAAAVAISGALNWRAETDRPPFTELALRRAIPVTPVRCQHQDGCRAALSVEHPLPERVLCTRHQPRHLRVVSA